MSREKQDIWTSLPGIFASTQGASTDQPRIIVRQEVHNGPKSVEDRDVRLVLTPEEAIRLAASILGLIPLSAVNDASERDLNRIWKFLEMIRCQ